MLPAQLRPADFDTYQSQARELVLQNLHIFQPLPAIFAAILLREVIRYDWKFPVERRALKAQLRFLGTLSRPKLDQLMAGFASIPISAELATEKESTATHGAISPVQPIAQRLC